jgi:cytoskeletal protein CcmA (bactofilin family)
MMRSALISLIAISAIALAAEEPDEIETLTRDVSLAADAPAKSVHSMMGAIKLARGSRVLGDVETGKGEIVLEPGSEVTGKLSNASGTIRIEGARVGGLVSTTYGDIYIGADSRLDGGILVHRRGVVGLSFGDEFKLGIPMGSKEPPLVVIGPRATVAGVLRFKREVKLLVSEGATIGRVVGATPIMFATEQPPLEQSDE